MCLGLLSDESYVLAGMRQVDDEYKLKQNIRIAMLYLEDDDAVNAEVFIKKAATLIANCKACLPFISPHNAPHGVNLCHLSVVNFPKAAWASTMHAFM